MARLVVFEAVVTRKASLVDRCIRGLDDSKATCLEEATPVAPVDDQLTLANFWRLKLDDQDSHLYMYSKVLRHTSDLRDEDHRQSGWIHGPAADHLFLLRQRRRRALSDGGYHHLSPRRTPP